MGVLSLFKKKKNYDTFVFEPPSPPPPPPPRLLDTFSPSNDAFTHGSLLDDVLNGLKTDMEVAPRLDTWQEQKEDRQQTIGESDNNRTSIYQQNMVTPSSPASMVTTTIPPESFAPSSAQLTPKVEPLSPVALESDIIKQQQQKLKAVVATTHRPSMIKSPSIVSSKPSLDDNNQEKRSRHSVGVSMSRMKERHRQECRRSLQPPPDSIPASPSFQQTPLIQQQQQQMVQRSYDPSSYPALVRSSSVMTDMYPSTPPSWRQQPLFPYQSDIVLPPYPVQLGNAIQSMYRMNQAQDIAAIPRSVSVYSGMPPQSNTNNNNWNHGLLQSPELYHHQQQRKSMPAIRGYQPQLLLPSMPDQPKKPKKQFIVDQQPSDAINNTTIEDPSMNNNAIETQPSFSSSSSLTKESSLFEEEKDKLQEDKQEQKQVTRSDSSYTVNTISNNDPTTVDTTGMNEKLKMIRTTVEQRSTRKQQRRRFSLPTMSTTGADLWKQKEQDDTKQQQQEIDIKKQQQQDDTKDNHQQTNFSTYSNVPIMSTPEQEEKLEVSCPHMHHPPPSPPVISP
ncbi:hypothetical protein BC941DRAFT_455575 [Chlamydoabsidia padenii]|nr:hypothetical protein BC941DRAFT_455575 [Chlamydoabsidia padenii]